MLLSDSNIVYESYTITEGSSATDNRYDIHGGFVQCPYHIWISFLFLDGPSQK